MPAILPDNYQEETAYGLISSGFLPQIHQILRGCPVSTKTRLVIYLVLLSFVDMILPVPILGIVLLYVVFQRPPWFIDVVSEIYRKK